MVSTGTPPRGAATPAQEWRWLPVLAVVVAIAMVVGGAKVGASLVTGTSATPLRVGGLEMQPRPGWDVVWATDSTAALHRGPVILGVSSSGPEPDGPAAVAERYVDLVLGSRLVQLAVADPAPTALNDGTPAVRFGYVGVTADGQAVEGVVVVATGVRTSAVFDAAAPKGELAAVAGDLRVMVDGARVA
jgi:hypothetical protein